MLKLGSVFAGQTIRLAPIAWLVGWLAVRASSIHAMHMYIRIYVLLFCKMHIFALYEIKYVWLHVNERGWNNITLIKLRKFRQQQQQKIKAREIPLRSVCFVFVIIWYCFIYFSSVLLSILIIGEQQCIFQIITGSVLNCYNGPATQRDKHKNSHIELVG